jgi:hypothetical protein
MQPKRSRQIGWVAGMGLVTAALTGCQTWVGGMTLPSGRYLEHRPQYFPPDPPFPLQRELATQESYSALAQPGGGAAAPGFGPVVPEAPAPGMAPPGGGMMAPPAPGGGMMAPPAPGGAMVPPPPPPPPAPAR